MNIESKIDLFFVSIMNWAMTGRICEDLYFTFRHYFFHILAALDFRWLPFIRQAEKQLKPYNKQLRPQLTFIERLGSGFLGPIVIFSLPIGIVFALIPIFDFPLLLGDTPDLTGILKTTGTILATLTGILFAILALSIHTTLAGLPGANFLLGAFVRKQGFLPIAALLCR